MADTTFVDGTTLTAADWFNDVNRVVYTILADPADAAAVRTAIDAQQDVFTTIGDTVVATTAGAAARLPAAANVAAHATTANIWVAREITLTGGVVTFTDIADAPYVGAEVMVKQNAAHVWTDGAVFNVQGGANYTAAADDWIRVYATTVSTFEVTIDKADGSAVVYAAAPITNSLGADVALNNTSNYFTGPTVAQGSVGTWLASGTVTLLAVGSTTNFDAKLWDGTTVIASGRLIVGAGIGATVSLSGYLATPAGNLRISAKASATDALITFNSSGNSKDSTISAIRLA